MANEELRWGMTEINIKNYTRWTQRRIVFDKTKYTQSYLTTSGKGGCNGEFCQTMERLKSGFDSDPRNNIRGHDFMYLLYLTMKRESGHHFGVKNPETFERLVFGFAELDDLKNFDLFRNLSTL